MKFTEDQLNSMSKPISDTEEERCKNALRMVSVALEGVGYTSSKEGIVRSFQDTHSFSLEMKQYDPSTFQTKKLKLLVQGSYANNTNIKQNSDVDVAIILESTFIPRYRQGVSQENYNFSDGLYTAKELKNDVEDALRRKFVIGVERRDKCVKVSGNTYRVDADVVPSIRYRDYTQDYDFNEDNYIGGINIYPDSGGVITNYPEQHIANGKLKNNDTSYCYKKMVRIAKNIKSIMDDQGYTSSKNISSFGLESLIWNVPDEVFAKYTIKRFCFAEVLMYLKNNIPYLFKYREANGIKNLCLTETDKYKQFIEIINNFYDYDI